MAGDPLDAAARAIGYGFLTLDAGERIRALEVKLRLPPAVGLSLPDRIARVEGAIERLLTRFEDG